MGFKLFTAGRGSARAGAESGSLRCEVFARAAQLVHKLHTASAVTDYREINDLAKDPQRAAVLAQFLLKLADIAWTDWEADFLEDMAGRREPLSTRQAEKLVELREASVRYDKVEGFVLAALIAKCWLNRHDLASDHDVAFIERVKASGATSLRRREAARLLRCACAIGEIEPYQGLTLDPMPKQAA
ncbi:MAG: hypothetical protein F9K29_01575 [Hyphomicrobiaceae bacterium]|nr:MAG: hypothetical protein F9K29_01575 [Hyphomicrobiaceae bacterium]